MFIISFSIFTILFTISNNIYFSILALFLFFIIISIISVIKYSFTYFIKLFGLVLLSFIIVIISVFTKKYNYFNNSPDFSQNYTGIITQAKAEPQGSLYIGTGIIVDTHSQGKYIFQDGKHREYFLGTSKKYNIGDEIRLTAYIFPGLTGDSFVFSKNIKNKDITAKSGLLNYEFDYPKRLLMKGFYGNLYEKNSIKLNSNKNSNYIQNIRKNLQTLVLQTYGENRISGLILGMLIGDRSKLSKSDYQGFIDSGLVHIIAVSGGNIVMIVLFLGFILIFLPFYLRNFFILIFVIFYVFLCGLDSSVFRAMLMGGMSLLAIFRGREVNIWRSLSISFIVMLIINPYFLVYDIGFLFSFSAIIGLIFIDSRQKKIQADKIKKNTSYQNTKLLLTKTIVDNNIGHKVIKFLQKQKDKFMKSYIFPTIGATLGILPVMSFFIGKINLLGLLANAFVLPVVPFVMIYGFISVFLYKLIHRQFLLQIEEILVNYIFLISDYTAKYGIYLFVNSNILKRILLVLAISLFLFWRLNPKNI